MIRRFWYILGTGVHVCTPSPGGGRVFPDTVLRAGAMTGKRRKKKSGSGNGAAETVKKLLVGADALIGPFPKCFVFAEKERNTMGLTAGAMRASPPTIGWSTLF